MDTNSRHDNNSVARNAPVENRISNERKTQNAQEKMELFGVIFSPLFGQIWVTL